MELEMMNLEQLTQMMAAYQYQSTDYLYDKTLREMFPNRVKQSEVMVFCWLSGTDYDVIYDYWYDTDYNYGES